MLGLRAPALTATPSSASWNGVTEFATILPPFTSSAIGPGFWLTRSTVPLANLFSSSSPSARITVTWFPLERENAAAISFKLGIAPWLLTMTRSAACAACSGIASKTPNMPAAANFTYALIARSPRQFAIDESLCCFTARGQRGQTCGYFEQLAAAATSAFGVRANGARVDLLRRGQALSRAAD